MRADEEMGPGANKPACNMILSPLGNCSHFEQCESIETVGFGPLWTPLRTGKDWGTPLRKRLGAETGREPDDSEAIARGAVAQLPVPNPVSLQVRLSSERGLWPPRGSLLLVG
jgi:hypothetical protein